MAKGQIITELRAWRQHKGLTLEAAGLLIVVGGKCADRAMWYSWEKGLKLPRDAWMLEIERVTGVEPNSFYRRPGTITGVPPPLPDPRQASLPI